MQSLILIIPLIPVAVIIYAAIQNKTALGQPSYKKVKQILQEHVIFYRGLTPQEKLRFEQSIQFFLQKVRLTGVKTIVEDIDRIFVAAAAIIPIFSFKGWEYRNIQEVFLYPNSFDKDYHIERKRCHTLGMEGNEDTQNVMILSQPDLRNGFLNRTDKSYTAIHNFVHLIDATDGNIDGLSEALLQHQYVLPWLKHIHTEIQQIKSGKSDNKLFRPPVKNIIYQII